MLKVASFIVFGLAAMIFSVSSLGVESPVLRGVVGMDGTTYVSLFDQDDAVTRSGWIKVGNTWRGWLVAEVAASGEWVVLKNVRGGSRRLALVRAQIAALREDSRNVDSLIALSELDWAWIRSPENEMRDSIIEIPEDIAISWENLSENERIKIRNFYRKRGIDAGVERKGNLIRVYHRRITDPSAPPADPSRLKPIESLGSRMENNRSENTPKK